MTNQMKAQKQKRSKMAGFSMIELMVSVALFLVVGGAALTLFKQHAPLFTKQQNLTNLNITMRNAMAQMQMDIVNAGTGYYPGVNFPDFPIGVTIQNNPPSSTCYDSSTNTYTSTCFDTLNIILVDPTTPPAHPSDSTGTSCVSTTSSTLFAAPSNGISLATLASYFHSGDQLLLVKSDGSQMTSTTLSADGAVAGGKVRLQHNPTASDGTNTSAGDPLGITTNPNNKLGTNFCSTDWILKMSPVTYGVDATDPTDPKLTRTQGGTTSVVAEQIIGFKVGATIFNAASDTSSEFYNFDNSATGYNYNYSLIRSVQLSMIGRTSPKQSGGSSFANSFDGGHYQIQAIEVEVNPRNLSMRDN